MPAEHRAFSSITECDPSDRESHTVAADIDGTFLVSQCFFPYFFLLAIEAGSLLHDLALLVLSPLVLTIYKLVSKAAGLKILIYVAIARLRKRDVELTARVVLLHFYVADSWVVFRACEQRRVVVMTNPMVMVEAFVREYLGVDEVLGMELEVDGRTGRVASPRVLVGQRKRKAMEREFRAALSELRLGDRKSDRNFMALCKVPYGGHGLGPYGPCLAMGRAGPGPLEPCQAWSMDQSF